MIRFACDGCGDLREGDSPWILGFAAENIGVAAARREVAIAADWNEERAVEALAVHFCSEQCQQDYMNVLFGRPATTLDGSTVVATKRILRTSQGSLQSEASNSAGKKSVKRTPGKRIA